MPPGSCGASRNGLKKLGYNRASITPCGQRLTVLGDVVEVVPTDDKRAGHFGRYDTAGQDAATDGDVASEWALLVCSKLKKYYISISGLLVVFHPYYYCLDIFRFDIPASLSSKMAL